MSDCILGTSLTVKGYGRVQFRGRRFLSHRLAWEEEHGPIPEGYCPHHTCGNKACMNTEHLELLTRGEHSRLHSRCEHGDQDRVRTGQGWMVCRICRSEANRRYYEKWKVRHV